MPQSIPRPGQRLTAISLPQASEVIRRSGSRHVSVSVLQADIDAGAPVNEDGTINLVEYAAWLARESLSGR